MLYSASEIENWSGTSEELVDIVNRLENEIDAVRNRPVSKRTVNYYRTKGILDAPTGKKYLYRHLLQCLLARKLSQDGWKVQKIADSVPQLSTEQCLFYLEQPVKFEELLKQATKPTREEQNISCDESGFVSPWKLSEELLAVRMLAKGVLKQFVEVENNSIVDGTNIPPELRTAMCLLSKFRINEGLVDHCASIHEVLNRCYYPLGDEFWNISKFQDEDFPYKDTVLIDIDHRCPTQDCVELGDIHSDADLRERYSFEEFINLCAGFGATRHQAYTFIRGFVVKNPIVETEELLSFLKANHLQKADSFLRVGCYRSIQEADLIDGKLYTCSGCGCALRKSKPSIGRCNIKQCNLFSVDQSLIHGTKPNSSLLILKAHLLLYWFGPGIDELNIFTKAESIGLNCTLFPNSDQCDVSIGGFDIGIDVKGYQNPKFLAQKLSKSIGGLSDYHKKIVAINDNVIKQQGDYLDVLKTLYSGSKNLAFMSVSDVLIWMEEL
ncbi:hypothetical protein [Pseudoalteromonas sp. MMG022]|uniref:restriction endonuclease-related protein n=1 Tax=Pseudoalteromonas sp. MMG022 TaxID=2909978 RepID=UPI001F17045F|nr:hypothetical protein [Pseudoalteromonas sp. MMG022]MCF6437768.1 hypothetical protein [Pseudoalteromonas sp. MMG022]